jgi:hypothetical protein
MEGNIAVKIPVPLLQGATIKQNNKLRLLTDASWHVAEGLHQPVHLLGKPPKTVSEYQLVTDSTNAPAHTSQPAWCPLPLLPFW